LDPDDAMIFQNASSFEQKYRSCVSKKKKGKVKEKKSYTFSALQVNMESNKCFRNGPLVKWPFYIKLGTHYPNGANRLVPVMRLVVGLYKDGYKTDYP